MDIRGVLFFRIQISPLSSECPVRCPPSQMNFRYIPCTSVYVAAPSQCFIISIIVFIFIIFIIIIIIIIIRLAIRIFRYPFATLFLFLQANG